MKGVIVEKLGGELVITDTLEKPTPGPNQILVKSLWTAMNPVDGFMVQTGMLVVEWPLVIGADASGIVVEAGDNATQKYGFKPGDHVCGCTRLGMKSYATGQEYFLMDAQVTMRKPQNVDLAQAATLGAGLETAALGIFLGLQVPLFDPEKPIDSKEEWIIVLGGGSSVGGSAIQIAKAAGYQVLASISARSAATAESLGAKTFDYTQPIEEQLEKVLDITGGNIAGIFDAAASDNPLIAKKLFGHKSWKSKSKLFATTKDWSNVGSWEGGETHEVELGPIGRDGAPVNETLEKYIPVLVRLVELGKVKPGDYEVVGKGFEALIEGYRRKAGGAGGQKKLVVHIADE